MAKIVDSTVLESFIFMLIQNKWKSLFLISALKLNHSLMIG